MQACGRSIRCVLAANFRAGALRKMESSLVSNESSEDLDFNEHGLARRALQIDKRLAGVWRVKNRRPCNQPVTPGASDFTGVFGRVSAIDLNGEVQSSL